MDNFLLTNKIERSISDLLRGLPIIFSYNEKKYLIFSAELFAEDIFFKILGRKNQFYNLVLTKEKAKKININSEAEILIKAKFSDIINIIDYQNSKKRYDNNFSQIDKNFSKCGIMLMKEPRLLPYFIFEEIDDHIEQSLIIDLQKLDQQLLDQYFQIKNNQNSLQEVSRSKIALKNAENVTIIIFRDLPNFGKVHVMILIGEQNSNIVPNIRIHSGCYTGDLLASLQCDCRDQLQEAIKYLNKEWIENGIYGAIAYQAIDEGRAIGLINKIRTYNLQSCSCNTIDANYEIGYEDDERNFISAANILKKMNINQCRLITNNPKKINLLEKENIQIVNRISILAKPNLYNQNYLNVKFTEMNHMNY